MNTMRRSKCRLDTARSRARKVTVMQACNWTWTLGLRFVFAMVMKLSMYSTVLLTGGVGVSDCVGTFFVAEGFWLESVLY